MDEKMDTPATEYVATSVLVLGQNGERWDLWLIISLALAALAAGIVVFTTAGSIISHKREAQNADRELEHYKLETNRDLIASKERIELLRNKNNTLEAAISPRIFEQSTLIEKLRKYADIEFIVLAPEDFESKRTAGQIRFVLKSAGWRRYPLKVFNTGFFDGINVATIGVGNIEVNEARGELVKYLRASGIQVELGAPLPKVSADGKLGLEMDREAKTPIIILVGPKPLPESLAFTPEGKHGWWGNTAD